MSRSAFCWVTVGRRVPRCLAVVGRLPHAEGAGRPDYASVRRRDSGVTAWRPRAGRRLRSGRCLRLGPPGIRPRAWGDHRGRGSRAEALRPWAAGRPAGHAGSDRGGVAREYPAVATASPAISSALAFEDGEKIARRTMLEIADESRYDSRKPPCTPPNCFASSTPTWSGPTPGSGPEVLRTADAGDDRGLRQALPRARYAAGVSEPVDRAASIGGEGPGSSRRRLRVGRARTTRRHAVSWNRWARQPWPSRCRTPSASA